MNSGSPAIDRPEICFENWCAMPESYPAPKRGQTGIFLRNDGRLVAHDISIEPIEINPPVTAHARKIAQIPKDGTRFAPVWLQGCERKWEVSAAMAEVALRQPGSSVYRGDYSVRVIAVYRDSRHFWYRTSAELRYLSAQHRLEFGDCHVEEIGFIGPDSRVVPVSSAEAEGELAAHPETETPASIHRPIPADGSIHPSKGGAEWKADDELGDKVHDLLDDYIQRMAESASNHRKLLAQFAAKSYDAHAAKRVELVRPGCQEDVARFDDGHPIRADLAVWQPLRSYGVRLDGDEPEAIELALTSARIRWKKMADRRARRAAHDADKVSRVDLESPTAPTPGQAPASTPADGGPAEVPDQRGGLGHIPQQYPKIKYHWEREPLTVTNAGEDQAIRAGWCDNEGIFKYYRGPRPARTDDQDATKWLDNWELPGMLPVHRTLIRACLLRADSVFESSPNPDPDGVLDSMRSAFNGIAKVLFEARLLTEDLLGGLGVFVWETAIAGGWYRLASESERDIFPEQMGRYWVWRDEKGPWRTLFRAEKKEWKAQLLERSTTPSIDALKPEGHSARGARRTSPGQLLNDSPTQNASSDADIDTGRAVPTAEAPDTALAEQLSQMEQAAEGIARPFGTPPYPMRAAWLETELALRDWNVHHLQGQGGPDWKTTRKILDGLQVSRSVLEKTAAALSKKTKRVLFKDIPQE